MQKIYLGLIFLTLAGCHQNRTVRQTVVDDVYRYRNICYKNAELGHMSNIKQVFKCESEHVMANAIVAQFSDLERLGAYYRERAKLAEKIDAKKVSPKNASAAEQEIDEKYADLFTDKTSDNYASSGLKFDEKFVDRSLLYYSLTK